MLVKNFAMAIAISAVGGLSALGSAAAQDAGVYTKEQAARGAGLYTANCAECHGRQLQGAEAPALIGKDVMGTFITGQGLYDYFSVAMPPSNPGGLGEQAYVEILSHILATNGAPAGNTPLVLANLEKVDLVKATTAAAAAPAGAAPAAAAAPAQPARLPQAFTAGRALPTVGAPTAPTPENAAPRLPQAFTAGRQLPTVAPSTAPLELPGPGAR
jgi:hypothetical protein